MYVRYIKRLLDFVMSIIALSLLSPLLLLLTLLGAIKLHGNPFFLQVRPGKDERLFKMVKFRSMNDECDENGNLLPDEMRLTRYGCFLRKTSLDELPELWNVFIGQMAFVGPRPLCVQYLPFYTPEEHLRHTVRPGITGYAQVNGRNATTWEKRFFYDLRYINEVSLRTDLKILFATVSAVFRTQEVGERGVSAPPDFDAYRLQQRKENTDHEYNRTKHPSSCART